MRRIIFPLVILFIAYITLGCDRDNGSLGAIVDGYVYDAGDSTVVPYAKVYIMQWNGREGDDTTKIFGSECDEKGYFYIDFQAHESYNFLFVKAHKEGYKKSSIENIDEGFTNWAEIYLYK